jgi:small-conductance mechanosensitive channel
MASKALLPILVILACCASDGRVVAQTAPPAAPPDPLAAPIAEAAKTARPADQTFVLRFANRPIVEFRATVLARTPATRAAGALDTLNRLAREGAAGRVTTRTYSEAIAIAVDDHAVFVLFPADADPLQGESLESNATAAAARLQSAFAERMELRSAGAVIKAVLLVLAVTAVFAVALWLVVRLDRSAASLLSRATERQLRKIRGADTIAGVARTPVYVRRLSTLGGVLLGLMFTYWWLSFVLRQFPYTRPWGESLRSSLFAAFAATGTAIVDQLPNVLTLLGIVIVTRFLTRLTTVAFHAVEEGRMTIPGLYSETAQPTRRIIVAMLWIFALILAYKYLPGSDSEIFKGVSVFIGLVVSLGSTGVMNQVMSGLMVTYSRALRVGDFVRIGETEGTVTQLGTLSTKIKTPRNEEITIPNAIVVSHATTNYSRNSADGVFAPTSVTIGYDVPWRQIQALLLLAAQRTEGVRQDPAPIVLQSELCDFYVKYTLAVCLARPQLRYRTLTALHANIQDAFNEYGVQIMSPNYEADPSGPKVVPPSRWYAAPAGPPVDVTRDSAGVQGGEAAVGRM